MDICTGIYLEFQLSGEDKNTCITYMNYELRILGKALRSGITHEPRISLVRVFKMSIWRYLLCFVVRPFTEVF